MARVRAETDDRVMALVEAELEKNPDIAVTDLQAMAVEITERVGDLTPRQFHARYPLQVKRRINRAARLRAGLSPGSGSGRRGPADGAPDRDAIREIFLRFASDLTAAEARKDLVRVLARVDRYIDGVIQALGR